MPATHTNQTIKLIEKLLAARPNMPPASAEHFRSDIEKLQAIDAFYTWMARANPKALDRAGAVVILSEPKFKGPNDEMHIGKCMDRFDPERKVYTTSVSFGDRKIEAHTCECPDWTAQTVCLHVPALLWNWFQATHTHFERMDPDRVAKPFVMPVITDVAKSDVPKVVHKIIDPGTMLAKIRDMKQKGPVGDFARNLDRYEEQAKTLDILFSHAVSKGGSARIFRSKDVRLSKFRAQINPLRIVADAQGSMGDPYHLRITFNPRGYQCTCPDGQRARDVGPCKHVLALATFWLTAMNKTFAGN